VPPPLLRPAAALAALGAALLPAAPRADVVLDAEAALRVGHVRNSISDPGASNLEALPALTLHFGSERIVLRARYLFSAALSLQGEGSSSYANLLGLSMAAQLTERSTATLSASASQGGTIFRLSQREVAQAELRPAGSASRVAGMAIQTLSWEAAPGLRLGQMAGAFFDAPQDALSAANAVYSGTLSADRVFPRDSFGAIFTTRYAQLHPATDPLGPAVRAAAYSLQGNWNRDLDQEWNAQLTAGFEHVAGEGPSSPQLVGSLAVRYLAGKWTGAVQLRRGAAANLEVGSMSLSDEVVFHATHLLDFLPRGTASASAGYLHATPLRAAGVAAGSGQAVSTDLGVSWDLWGPFQASLRYALSRALATSGTTTSTTHILLGSVTYRYSTAEQTPSPVPTPGGRVDGGDGVRFPGNPRRP